MATPEILPIYAPPSNIPPPNLNGTVGAILVGGLVTAVLYGITSLQTVVYYQHSPRDNWFLKSAVGVIWVLDTLDMVLISHTLYWYLVTNYGNPEGLSRTVWSTNLHILVTALTECAVRAMFAVRVWKLSERKVLPTILVAIITIMDLVFSLIITIKSWGKTFEGLSSIQGYIYAQFSTDLMGDTLLVGFMCYFLSRMKTGFTSTDSMIKVLTAYVINSGLLTVVAIVANIVLFGLQLQNLAFIALYFVISKLYANAYLAMLNAREHIRETAGGDGVASVHLSRLPNHDGAHLHADIAGSRASQALHPALDFKFEGL